MKKIFAAIAASALLLGPLPAAAQSFVMVFGKREQAETREPATPITGRGRLQKAIERACVLPSIRDLKGRVLFEQCVDTARVVSDAETARADTGSDGEVTVELALR